MMVPTNLRDVWTQFDARCGSEPPACTEDDLRRLIYLLDLAYRIDGAWEQPEGASEDRWAAAWEAIYETGWAWDKSVSDEAVVEYYRRIREEA